MAEVIPPMCLAVSPGEKEIFARFSGDPAAKNWVILHSVDVAHHASAVSGELDFVVIIPGEGVVCVEVKAHKVIRRGDDGLWYLGSETATPRSPFKQVSGSMHSLRNYLVKRAPELSKVPFWSCVIMPFATFKTTSPEWQPWQCIDASRFSTVSCAHLILDVIHSARKYLHENPSASWFDISQTFPDSGQCATLRALIRGAGGTRPLLGKTARDEAEEFTKEQFLALDSLAYNPRILFEGPAGTGKTVLALEAALRSAAAGKSTLLTCFNRLLCEKLKASTRGIPNLKVGTLHSIMLEAAKRQAPIEADQRFWREQLPVEAVSNLWDSFASGNEILKFEKLIVDEAQDILLPEYLDFLDLCLSGGLVAGNWYFFGDFDRQLIYRDESALAPEGFIQNRGGAATGFRLGVNCRNTPRVVGLLNSIAKPDPGYTRVLRPDGKRPPACLDFRDEAHQQQLLMQQLRAAWADGLRGNDIIVLSPQAAGCASRITESPWKERLKPVGEASGGEIPWCSVYAYKGLEAPFVIVTDINDLTSEHARRLLYVGLTRSLDAAVLLISKDASHALMDFFTRSPL